MQNIIFSMLKKSIIHCQLKKKWYLCNFAFQNTEYNKIYYHVGHERGSR